MGHPNMHKGLELSQLRKTDMGALERNSSTRTRPVGQPHTARHDAPNRTMPQERKYQMGHLNMHKAPGWSQLCKTKMGALKRNDLTQPERT